MTDRRRINGPTGTTIPAIFAASPATENAPIQRTRKPNELRSTFLQSGVIPNAAGSAYLELESRPSGKRSLVPTTPTIKLSCAVHGPKPVSRTASFSPNLQLSASVKFAPFATRVRRGYIRGAAERDLGLHLENALKGAIIPDRWPKSAVEVAVTVLEGEEDWTGKGERISGVGLFNVLAACVNVASAALADARIDCLDLLVAGVAATVNEGGKQILVMDPGAAEHADVTSTCAVSYLPARDEVVDVWTTGSIEANGPEKGGFDDLLDNAIAAAKASQTVVRDALVESLARTQTPLPGKGADGGTNDVEMKT